MGRFSSLQKTRNRCRLAANACVGSTLKEGPLRHGQGTCSRCSRSVSSTTQCAAGKREEGADPSKMKTARMMELLMSEEEMMLNALYPFLPKEMRNKETCAEIFSDPKFQDLLEGIIEKEHQNPIMQRLSQQLDFEEELGQLDRMGAKLNDVAQQMDGDPELSETLSNPVVQQAILEVSQDQENLARYVDNPEVMGAFNKIVAAGSEVAGTLASASDQESGGRASPSSDGGRRQARTREMFQLVMRNDMLQQAVFWFLPEEARTMHAFAWMLSQEEHHNDAVMLMESMMEVSDSDRPQIDMKIVEMWIKVSEDPELEAALDDSDEVQAAVLDVVHNGNPERFAGNPEAMKAIAKVMS